MSNSIWQEILKNFPPVLNYREVERERETPLLDRWLYVTFLQLPVTSRVWGFMMSHDTHFIFLMILFCWPQEHVFCLSASLKPETWAALRVTSVSLFVLQGGCFIVFHSLVCCPVSRPFESIFSDAVPMTYLFPLRNVQFASLRL